VLFDVIAQSPKQYPAVDHIAPDYRRSVYGSYYIYYRTGSDYILIMRILGQQEAGTILSKIANRKPHIFDIFYARIIRPLHGFL